MLTLHQQNIFTLPQTATSKPETERRGGRRYLPHVFTEHGAIMAATILNTDRAVQMSVYVVRAFLKLRELLASNEDLAGKLEELEKSVANLDASARRRFEAVYAAIRALIASPTRHHGRSDSRHPSGSHA